jgi:lipoate synthase
MIPGRRPEELVHDQTFHIAQGRNLLGILAVHVGQQALQGEVHMALTCLGLSTLLVGLGEVMQALNHVLEDVRGNDAIVQQFRLTLCPDDAHLFASLRWHAKRGWSLEAIDITMGYITQEG